MIVIHIDTQHDTSLMDALYMGLDEEIRLLYNPTRELIDEVLEDNPTESLMCVGHGTEDGLLGYLGGYAIDEQSVPLLKTREVIGVWCNACDFAKAHKGVRGFFTDMFISNPLESRWFGYDGHDEEETDGQNMKFCDKVCELLNGGIPMSEWVGALKEWCDKDIDFVAFNYGISCPQENDIMYFDGTQGK